MMMIKMTTTTLMTMVVPPTINSTLLVVPLESKAESKAEFELSGNLRFATVDTEPHVVYYTDAVSGSVPPQGAPPASGVNIT